MKGSEINIKMKITSTRYEVEESYFSKLIAEFGDEDTEIDIPDTVIKPEGERIEISTEGIMCLKDGMVELKYEETELTGMEGSTTSVSFSENEPGLISMFREGSVSTALVFEEGKRHHCIYETPLMPFEICVRTFTVDNRILSDGILKLDYIIEIRGAKAERNKFELRVY